MVTDSAIVQIIRRCGGADAISLATDGKVGAAAVYKWVKNGIPDRHWTAVIKLSGATAAELLAANQSVREVVAS